MTAAARPHAAPVSWRERLFVPPAWWVIALVFMVSIYVALAFYLGPLAGAVGLAVATAIVGAVLVSYGSLVVSADDAALTVGPHRIEWRWVASAVALNRVETRRRMGPDADARAHLVTRPYVSESVEVTLADPADPHPYWLVGSRSAAALAAVINSRVSAATAGDRPDG